MPAVFPMFRPTRATVDRPPWEAYPQHTVILQGPIMVEHKLSCEHLPVDPARMCDVLAGLYRYWVGLATPPDLPEWGGAAGTGFRLVDLPTVLAHEPLETEQLPVRQCLIGSPLPIVEIRSQQETVKYFRIPTI